MKNWLLYFFALLIATTCLPLIALKTVAAREMPNIRISQSGVVTETDMEDYVLRVLLAEGKGLENREALKALAISIRSMAAYAHSFGLKHSGFEFCDNSACCPKMEKITHVSPERLSLCSLAAEGTKGVILYHDGKPAPGFFTLCGGSGTTDCEDFPFLSAVKEDEACQIHKYSYIIEKSVLAKTLNKADVDFENSSCLVYNQWDKCCFGVFGGKYMQGDELQKLLSAPSAQFSMAFDGENIEISGAGIGNGMGLNLCGAEKMANNNFSAEKIIGHYFPKGEMVKIYD